MFRQQNWEWIEPYKLEILIFNGEETIQIDQMPWPETMHKVREGMRFQIINQEQLHLRHDLKGLRDGIDFEKTRQNLSSVKLTWLQRGMLRTILCGACWTPSRMLQAGCLTPSQAKCIHCTLDVTETLGHRFWKCPRWHSIRTAHGLNNFAVESWPKALTRCGVCPANLPLDHKIIGQIQLMMIAITEAVSENLEAQKQFKTARRPDGKKARDESQYLHLQQALSGN